jgi:hypothetical protein
MTFTITAPHHQGPAVPDLAEGASAPRPKPQDDTARVRAQTPLRSRLLGHTVLAAVAVFCVFPVYWLYACGTRSRSAG